MAKLRSTDVFAIDEIFMAHASWLQSVLNMRVALNANFKLVVLGDDAQCIPVVDLVDTGATGLTCANVNVINIVADPNHRFTPHTLTYAWRFRDDPQWGEYVLRIAEGSAPDISEADFPSANLQVFVARFRALRNWPPVLAPLKETCRVVNSAIAATFGEPMQNSEAVIYAGEDLLIGGMLEIPMDVERTLPLYAGATYTVIEGTSVMLANPITSPGKSWVTLTKHELVIVNSVSGVAGVHATVISDERKGRYDVVIPKRVWTHTTADMNWMVLQYPI